MSTARRYGVTAVLAAMLLGSAGSSVAGARTIDISAQARLRLVDRRGGKLVERGTATGTLPGRVQAVFGVSLFGVNGTVTLFPAGGSLTMTVAGSPKRVSKGSIRFEGTMRVVAGTGRFEGARGSATFTGTVDRTTWAAAITRATGRLTY